MVGRNRLSLLCCFVAIARVSGIYDPSVTTTKPPIRREYVVPWYLDDTNQQPPIVVLDEYLRTNAPSAGRRNPDDTLSWPKDEFLIDEVGESYIKKLEKQKNKKDDFAYEGVSFNAKKPKKENLIQAEPQVAIYDKKLGVKCPTDRASGLFVFPPDCQYFVNCVDGAAYVQQCAPGTAFNQKTLECDYRHKVKCYSTEHSELNALSHNRQVVLINSDSHLRNIYGSYPGERGREHRFDGGEESEARCLPYVSGLQRHPTDCTKYLQCVHGATIVRDCGPGTAFNPAVLVCDWPHNVEGCENLGYKQTSRPEPIMDVRTDADDLSFAPSSLSGWREPKVWNNPQNQNRDPHNFNRPPSIPGYPPLKPVYNVTNGYQPRDHSLQHHYGFQYNHNHSFQHNPNYHNRNPTNYSPENHSFHNFNYHHNHNPSPNNSPENHSFQHNPNYHHNHNQNQPHNHNPNFNHDPVWHQNHSPNHPFHNPLQNRNVDPDNNYNSTTPDYIYHHNFNHNHNPSIPNFNLSQSHRPHASPAYDPKEARPSINNVHRHQNPAVPSKHYRPNVNYNHTPSVQVYPESLNRSYDSRQTNASITFGSRGRFPEEKNLTRDNEQEERRECEKKFSENPILRALARAVCYNFTRPNQSVRPDSSDPYDPVLLTTPSIQEQETIRRPGIRNQSNYHPISHHGNPVWTPLNQSSNNANANPRYDSPPYYPPVDSDGQESNLGNPQILAGPREPNIYNNREPELDNTTPKYRPVWRPRDRTTGGFVMKITTEKPWPPPLDPEGHVFNGHSAPFEMEPEKFYGKEIDDTTWKPIERDKNLVSGASQVDRPILGNESNLQEGPSESAVEKSTREPDTISTGKTDENDPKDIVVHVGYSRVNGGKTQQDQGSGPKPPRLSFGLSDHKRRTTMKPVRKIITTSTTTTTTTTIRSPSTTTEELENLDNSDYGVDVLDVEKETWKPTLVYENKTRPDESKPTTATPEDKSVIMKIGEKNKKESEIETLDFELAPWDEVEEEPFPVYYIPGVTPMNLNVQSASLTPISGQYLRLRGGPNPREGYVEVQGVQPGWGIICDTKNSWSLKEAHIVCKQLGYLKGAEMAWQGRGKQGDIPDWIAANSVQCLGNETRFQQCRFTHEESCRVEREAVGVRCLPNRVAHCERDETPHENHCYHLANPEQGLNHAEALEYCKRRGSGLIDVVSQAENNFVSEWLTQNHPEVASIMTSGVGFKVMNLTVWLWENNSNAKFRFAKWWPGWSSERNMQPWTNSRPSCVVMKRWFPCSNRPDESCKSDYFFWDIEDCSASQKGHSYVCKRPYDDIGCVYGKGNQYSGNASVTSTGKKCLPWSDKAVQHPLMLTVVNQEVRTELMQHKFCRNPNPKSESKPWCYTGPHAEMEYCDIPSCGFYYYGSGKNAAGGGCKPKHFECLPGECIPSPWVCDGEEDCTNGVDEKTCSSHLSLFKKVAKHKLEGYDVEKWLNTPIKTCALRCKDADFTCRSFTHKAEGNVCLLSDSNVGMTGGLKEATGYDYYELESATLDCTNMFICDNNKCVNQTSVCDGKNDCNDHSDENVCSKEDIGYEIRLAGSNNTNEGRLEVKAYGRWGQVCDDGFGMINAGVVCKELGFQYGALQVRPGGFYGNMEPATMFMVDQLQCRGDENSLRECNFDGWGVHNCLPEEAVGIVCRTAVDHCQMDQWKCDESPVCISTSYICDEVKDCPDGSDESPDHCNVPVKIRLVNGTSDMEGRVELRHHGIWGTVCDDDFNIKAATVVCRSLGYGGTATFMKNGYYGSGTGPIWLDSVFCHGNETQLHHCDHNSWGHHNCNHNEDVGVICSPGEVDTGEPTTDPPIKPNTNIRDVLPTFCGMRSKDFTDVEDEIFGKIVRGNVAPKGSYPWQASIRLRAYSRSSHWCGAVVLSPIHVLTAAHCLYGYNKGSYFVRAGDYNSEIEEETEAEANIEDYYIHEEFAKGHRFNNDIALVLLKGNGLPLGKDIMPICLPRENAAYTPGLNCTISGFGSIEFQRSGHSRDMRFGWVPLLDQSVCRAEYVYGEGAIRDGMVCAGHLDEGVDTCDGDSGGPLACLENGAFTLYGLTSWGQSCGRANKPGVYVRISHYRQWIVDKILESLAGR